MQIIKECKSSDFIKNINEINSFFQAKKIHEILDDSERLINLLKTYIETIIYYKKFSNEKFIVEISNKLFVAKVDGVDNNGNNIELDILDIYEQFTTDIIKEIRKTISEQSFEKLVALINVILLNPNISIMHKLLLINSESISFQNEWDKFIRYIPESVAIEAISTRKKVILNTLKEPSKYQEKEIDLFIESLNKSYITLIEILLKLHISKNHKVEIFKTIENELYELNKNKHISDASKKLIISFLLNKLTLYNNLFQFEPKEQISDIISNYENYIDEKQSLILEENLNFHPENFTLDNTSIELAEPNFEGLNLDNIHTIISFTISKENEEFVDVELDYNIKVEFSNITNLFEDPIYTFLDSTNLVVGGMPITFLSDSINDTNNVSLVSIIIPSFFHPDFTIIDNKIVEKDFSLEKAKHGGKYYPHKDFLIEILYELFEKELFPFEINKEEINSNFISNFLVNHIDVKNNKLIHHKLYSITNFDTFQKIKNSFLAKLNEKNYNDEFLNIKELLFIEILNHRDFLNWCYKMLELTIKKSIEFSGLHKSLWHYKKDIKELVKEVDAQTIIYNMIKDICSIKGIKVFRETMAADGSLDFHLHYTKENESMNVCIELKNAHHDLLIHGIESQLPLYIKAEGRQEGIFLVLWYKCDIFEKPNKYNDIQELNKLLKEKVPEKYKIKPMIIDCTPKISPSIKASENRLKV